MFAQRLQPPINLISRLDARRRRLRFRADDTANLIHYARRMQAKLLYVGAIDKVVTPTIKFTVELTFSKTKEIPTSACGVLHSPNDTLVTPLFELPDHNYPELGLQASPVSAVVRSNTTRLYFGAQLGPRELEHIESVRLQDAKKDVWFFLKFTFGTITSTAEPWPTEDVRISGQKPATVLGRSANPDAKAIIREDPSKGFLFQKTVEFEEPIRIAATDWIHDYAPKLGLGRFAVLEIPEFPAAAGELNDRIRIAVEAADKAADSLRKGEWNDACEDLRGVWESLRNYDVVKTILLKDGYSDAAGDLLNGALNNLFDLASKFAHKLDKNKRVLPELRAQREDAYAAYLVARSTLNLIARKARRVQLFG
jgi:hypothetical protein